MIFAKQRWKKILIISFTHGGYLRLFLKDVYSNVLV